MPPESAALVVSDRARSDIAVCKALLAHGSKSFSAASWLLPRRIRDDAAVFYAFCRVADDAVDDSADPARAVARLHVRLERVFADQPEDDAVDRALARLVSRHAMPKAPLLALLEGFEWDAQERRYRTLTDVLAYSARVASAVGVVMTYLMGARDRDTLARACDLGAAMQLTNICRDVGEDARRGRVYVPESWLDAAGVDLRTWRADPVFEPGVGQAVQRLLAEASRLYARAQPGIAVLPSDCRPAIRAASTLYADIGRVVATRGFDSVSGRASTGLLRKLWLLGGAWLSGVGDTGGLDAPALPEVEFLLP